jgi:hypothetical protein
VPGSGFGSRFPVRFKVPGSKSGDSDRIQHGRHSSLQAASKRTHVVESAARNHEPWNLEPNQAPGTEPGTWNPEPGTL